MCLIRRKDAKSWGIPKGMVERGHTLEETALNEAFEEAGLKGRLLGDAIGTYHYDKWGRRLNVAVYLMKVSAQADDWDEAPLRQRKWVSFDKAASLLGRHPVLPLLDRARSVFGDGPRKTSKAPKRRVTHHS